MTILAIASVVACLLAGLAAMMFLRNLPQFTRWRGGLLYRDEVEPAISVLIPARDEQAGIEDCIRAALANTGVSLEVVVLDDGSSDDTATIVRKIAAEDVRVRLLDGVELPKDWNGKQHACYQLAEAAKFDLWLFLDADVRLRPTALQQLSRRKAQILADGKMSSRSSRQVAESHPRPISLLSAFPKQETGTLLEKMLIPMMHQILLCYLPFSRMRASTHPAYAAGCGQLFFTDRESYQLAGTHRAIRGSRHDGLKLPKIYRQQGLMTDCVDGTAVADCRMYHGAQETLRGLLKNADEGIANPRLLIPFTVLLGGAHVLPWITLGYAISLIGKQVAGTPVWVVIGLSAVAILLAYLPRWMAIHKFKQSWLGGLLHPLAVVLFLSLQWWAFFNGLRGKKIAWRGRTAT